MMHWWREPTVALVASIISGLLAWTAFYAGQRAGGFVEGAVVLIFLLAIGFAIDSSQRFWTLLGWGVVFFGIVWPLLWLMFWTPF